MNTSVHAGPSGRHRRRALVALAAGGLIAAAPGIADAHPASGDETVTLSLTFVDDPIGSNLIAAFEEAHPNIDIDASMVPFNDFVTSIRLTMTSDSAPDIVQYNAGAMRSLIPAGELLALDDIATELGWDESFPASSLDVLRTDETAKQFGTGSLYSVPGGLSVTGVYYNKAIADELGIEMPISDIAGLEAAFDTALAADVAPMYVGGLDVNHIHWWAALLNAQGATDEYRAWAYGDPEATIETDAARAASDTIIEWVEAGYIPDSANGMSRVDAAAEFSAGNALFHFDGNWAASTIGDALGDDAGFFIMPQVDGSTADVASGASVSWAISARTEHPEEAAMFLDWMASEEAAATQVESGFMPVNAAAAPEVEGVVGEINAAFVVVAEGDGIVPFPDHPAPGLLEVETAGLQGLIAGQMSTDEFLASLQSTWSDFVTS